MKLKKVVFPNVIITTVLAGGMALLATGCVQRRVVQVPVYQTYPAYTTTQPVASQPVYQYPEQTAYAPPPATAPQAATATTTTTTTVPDAATAPAAPVAGAPAPVAQAQPQPAVAAPQTVVVQTAPPAPIQEVIPVAPGPDYYWTPGYWSWNGASWIWVRGAYVVRPRPGAVWVGGHWARHGRGYVWVGGRWRY